MKLKFALLALVATFGPAPAQTNDPAVEAATFTVAPPFQVNLFASEKEGVVKPIQMRFDPQGRIWVIGSTVYPQLEPGQVPNDKVIVLEDTNHDGVCDKTTVFAEGLMIPTGLELGDGGVYLGHGTDLLFLKDTDGDGKADERRVLLRGFGTGDNHQNINSFMFGPGGELWMCQGLHIRSNVETPWGIVRLHEAGIWRYRPKLKKLEGFYGNANEPQNPWGYVFTDWGEPILLAGNNSSHIYPVPGLTSAHFPDPPTLIWRNGAGRKSSGGDVVGTAHFPDDWQGTVITGGYINNAVWSLRIVENQSGFALEDREPLIKSTDRSFRPVDVKFGPDGALYICDWYNPIIGHYQASFRDPNRDKSHGRIWRVTAKGRPLTPRPNLAGASIPQLLDYLKSSDRWTRQFAKRALNDKPTQEVVPAVTRWAADASVSELVLKEALGVLQAHEAVDRPLLERLSHAKEPGARAYAAGVVGEWAERLTDPLALLNPNDPSPRVRLRAAVAASYVPQAASAKVLERVAAAETDVFIAYALRQAVYALKPVWLPALRAGKLEFGTADGLSRFLSYASGADTLEALRQTLRDGGSTGAARRPLLAALMENGESTDLGMLLSEPDFEAHLDLLQTFVRRTRARGGAAPAEGSAWVARLTRSERLAIKAAGLRLAGLWKLAEGQAAVYAAVNDASQPAEVRAAAFEALAGYGDGSMLSRFSETGPEELRAAAIIAQASIYPASAAGSAARLLAQPQSVAITESVSTALLGRTGGSALLAKAFLEEKPTAQNAEAVLRVMNATGRRDEALVSALGAAAGGRSGRPDVAVLARSVRESGHARQGQQIFLRPELGCVACHAVKGQGGAIGPDLGAIGTAQPIEFIIGAILEPQREVKEGYNSMQIVTKGGDEYQGLLARENDQEVVIRDVLQNAEVRVRKSDIQTRKIIGSVMPAGLVDGLNQDEFRDLVRYLSELGRVE